MRKYWREGRQNIEQEEQWTRGLHDVGKEESRVLDRRISKD
jgi:hypothetical protein